MRFGKNLSVMQRAAGGLIGLVIAMLVESVLLIIRTSEYSKDKKVKGKASRSQPLQHTAAATIPIAATSQDLGPAEPKKDR